MLHMVKHKLMKRGFIFKMHSIAGLLSGLFVLAMSLSGSLLVFHDELDKLAFPVVKNWPLPALPVDSCYRSLQKQYPHAQISNCMLADNAAEPILFTIYDSSYKTGTAAL